MGTTESSIEITAQHAANKEIHAEPPPNMKDVIEKASTFKKYKGNPQKIKEIYDAAVEGASEAVVTENLQFLSKMHGLKELKKKGTLTWKHLNGVYKDYIRLDQPMTVTISSESQTALTEAAPFKKAETDPEADAWKKAEGQIADNFRDYLLHNFEKTKAYKNLHLARESYENELDFYNDEYYDQSDYQFIDYGEFNNIPAIPEHGYNGYVNNKYIGHGSDINGFVDPTLMLLIGLMFCLCFVLTGVFSMISGACCYVFSRYKYNEIFINKNKNENEYENINRL